jgi:uncharacterized membrane protein YukC
MRKFIDEAERAGIDRETILEYLQRDIQEKEHIFKLIKWIKIRQVVSICLATLLVCLIIPVLWVAISNGQRVEELIKTLVVLFIKMNGDTPVE